jgi:hypothetical protein
MNIHYRPHEILPLDPLLRYRSPFTASQSGSLRDIRVVISILQSNPRFPLNFLKQNFGWIYLPHASQASLISLTSWNRSFFILLIVADLIKKLPVSYGNRKLIHVHIGRLLYSVSANLIHFPPPHLILERFILISSYLSLDPHVVSFHEIFISPICAMWSTCFLTLDLITPVLTIILSIK